ncbi:MAG: TadE/TadG family type IV pilus assembly protein, partial [Chloroflexota bacterium]
MDKTMELHNRRRTGQTLAEFAITLPILLLLLFGIIEFGRIFQAWVTLQNAARAGARYATTGIYNTARYQLDLELGDSTDPNWWGDYNSIVPCLKNAVAAVPPDVGYTDAQAKAINLAQRGTAGTYILDPDFSANSIQVFENGPESIYATYYGGDDCDPSDDDDQNRRKDLARILSVYDEARRGAAGLGLGSQLPPEPQVGFPGIDISSWTNDMTTWTFPGGSPDYPDKHTVPWYQVWDRPLPGTTVTPAEYNRLRHSNEPGWFDVNICSTRAKLLIENEPVPDSSENRFSFPIVLNGTEPLAPACLLQENPVALGAAEADGWTHNVGRPWLDAGGPGDTVSIVVSFNHPLITPLGLASYLPLQARRVAVNESFRSPRAVPPSYDQPEPGEIPP